MSQRVLRKRTIVVTTSDDEDGCWLNSQRQSSFSQGTQRASQPATSQSQRTQTLRSSQSFNFSSQPNFSTHKEASSPPAEDASYPDRLKPTSPSDLAVNPTKLQELKDWLKKAKVGSQRLLLTGPPGAGKSTSVEVLSRSLDIALLIYEAELLCEVNATNGTVYQENATTAFFDFLRNPRKPCGDTRPAILLIDSLPLSSKWNFKDFQNDLACALRICKFSIVFCLSDDSTDYWHSYKAAFTSLFMNENNITSMSFLPIANRFMDKALAKANNTLKLKLSSSTLKEVASIASGDIRAALNIIQFSLSNSGNKANLEALHQGAFTSTIFHQIGSLLNAKRKEVTDDSFDTCNVPSRPPLIREAEEILEMTNASPAMITSFLHEHEPNFSPSISATRRVFELFSYCDSLSSRWEFREKVNEYSAQICTRAVQFHNYGEKENKSRSTYCITKPKFNELEKDVRSSLKQVQSVVHILSLGSDAFSLVLPMLPWIRVSVDKNQSDIISYLTRPLTFSRLAGYQQWITQRNQQLSGRLPNGPLILTSRDNKSVLLQPDIIIDSGSLLDSELNEDFVIDDSDENVEDNELYDSFDDGY
ncbi:unnamed protein product [Auanema sp. JU1783]|nr:unnamed protein product [Auanema sp. JU1783]